MTHAIDTLLRPLIRWYFQSWFWKYLPKKEKILWFFCKDYFVVGEKELCRTLKKLTSRKYRILLNSCGDDAKTLVDAEKTWKICNRLIDIVLKLQLRRWVTLSVKNSRFGCFEKEIKYHGRRFVELLVARARHADIRIVFDGERLKYCRWVLTFAYYLNQRYGNVGVRLQAYGRQFLPRFKQWIEKLDLAICKGAYAEPLWRALASVKEIFRNILDAVEYAVRRKRRVEVDTHDYINIITKCQEMYNHELISYGHLMNVKASQARDLRRRDNEEVFIYLVYLEDMNDDSWMGFSIRRLVEKPTYMFLPLKRVLDRFFKHEEY